jgi:hypothetical protein
MPTRSGFSSATSRAISTAAAPAATWSTMTAKRSAFSCDVECGGGGLEIALSKDDKSAIVNLEVIGVWDRKHPKRDAMTLEGGADDKVFRLDRVDNAECADLLTNHPAMASLQRK